MSTREIKGYCLRCNKLYNFRKTEDCLHRILKQTLPIEKRIA